MNKPIQLDKFEEEDPESFKTFFSICSLMVKDMLKDPNCPIHQLGFEKGVETLMSLIEKEKAKLVFDEETMIMYLVPIGDGNLDENFR